MYSSNDCTVKVIQATDVILYYPIFTPTCNPAPCFVALISKGVFKLYWESDPLPFIPIPFSTLKCVSEWVGGRVHGMWV